MTFPQQGVVGPIKTNMKDRLNLLKLSAHICRRYLIKPIECVGLHDNSVPLNDIACKLILLHGQQDMVNGTVDMRIHHVTKSQADADI